MNGMELMKMVKVEFEGKIPVVLQTGHCEVRLQAKWKEEGFDEIIEKPCDVQIVMNLIRKYHIVNN